MVGIKSVWIYANNIIRSARHMVNAQLKTLDLSSAEGNVLLHLLNQGELLRQEDIVEQLEISKTAVSKAVNCLEEKGYVVRVEDEHDRRAVRLKLTAEAEKIAPELKEIYEQIFALAAEGLEAEEIAAFIKVFQRISNNFSRRRWE